MAISLPNAVEGVHVLLCVLHRVSSTPSPPLTVVVLVSMNNVFHLLAHNNVQSPVPIVL